MEDKKFIYTQEDMDNITSKVKESQKAKYEKTHISLETYKELESKYNELVNQGKVNAFKEIFKSNNGNVEAYEDFISTNKEILDLDPSKQIEHLNQLKECKSWYFNSQNARIDNNVQEPQNNQVVKDLLGDYNEGLIEGTIYKNKF